MSSITKRSSGQWRARYRDEAGKEHARHFQRKTDAQAWLDDVTASIVRGDYVDPKSGRETFCKHAAAWLEAQPLRPSTRYAYESVIRLHMLPTFGDRQLVSIRPSEVQAWVTGLELAASTAGMVHGLLYAIFKAGVLDRKIRVNPCSSTKLPEVEVVRVVPPTTDQILTLHAEMPEHLRMLITFGAGTGVRQSEAFGVTLDRVNFLRRMLTIDRQFLTVPGQAPSFGPPKTKASVRDIPLPISVTEALAEHLQAFPALDDGPFEGLIFHNMGEPWTRQSFGHIWRPVARKAGLSKGTGFHTLRHYYASLLIRHGESVKTVQARLGHASATETLDTYSHLWPDSEDRTREAVDTVFVPLADSLRTAGA